MDISTPATEGCAGFFMSPAENRTRGKIPPGPGPPAPSLVRALDAKTENEGSNIMAFKTRKQIAELRARETPYTIDDLKFRGKKLRRVTLTITMDGTFTDGACMVKGYRATHRFQGKTQKTVVEFSGQRRKDFEGGAVYASMEEQRQAFLRNNIFDCENISREIVAEGFWKPRSWRDASGVEHTDFHFVAAKWQFQPPCENAVIEEGATPEV